MGRAGSRPDRRRSSTRSAHVARRAPGASTSHRAHARHPADCVVERAVHVLAPSGHVRHDPWRSASDAARQERDHRVAVGCRLADQRRGTAASLDVCRESFERSAGRRRRFLALRRGADDAPGSHGDGDGPIKVEVRGEQGVGAPRRIRAPLSLIESGRVTLRRRRRRDLVSLAGLETSQSSCLPAGSTSSSRPSRTRPACLSRKGSAACRPCRARSRPWPCRPPPACHERVALLGRRLHVGIGTQ